MKKNTSIIGASGYSGAELLSILLRHPQINVTRVFANSSAGKKVSELYPLFRSTYVGTLTYEEYALDKIQSDDIIFIALPSGEAMNYVPALVDAGKKVIDLGGDFRLQDTTLYQKYYKHEHMAAAYLPKAVYGLPEWNKKKIIPAQLIANPGCYVTSALLPLLPLVKENLIEPTGITISSMSGVSGAGRKSSIDLSFTEVNESVKAYKVGTHQHTPEIETVLRDFGGKDSTVTFAPHLIPITRGIYSSIYVTPKSGLTNDILDASYKKYYTSAPFVRLIGDAEPEIKNVQYTNYIDIGWKMYERNNQVILLSVIDNLVKGAAGQAVQNMNLMFGFDETESLL
ncbi:MAG: N-acetyl-gamma-glutamyl-phosphate reductase [Ignavibacteriales bacterium]|nr:N-acetyl-gamma-glutamyl-phosphate reductase [Ignavibacteriales bacterium]